MKTRIFYFILMSFCLMACSSNEAPVVGDSLFGHWEWCDAVDAQYRPITPDHSETLFLENDSTWKKFRDNKLEAEGTFVVDAEEHYLDVDGVDLGRFEYLEFTDKNANVRREYFEYRKSEDRLVFLGTPGATGLPFKMWRRIK